jgi:ribosomal-protein-alanine N-acetyltransferase
MSIIEMAQQTKVNIRWMIRRDLEDVVKIENECFEHPWQTHDFVLSLRQKNCIGMVGEWDGEVVAYMVYNLHKSQIELLNFAVDPDFTRRGAGRQLVDKLIGKLASQRRTCIVGMVRERNVPAQMFFKAMGFRWIGTWPGYYDETEESAYQMRYSL